MIEKLKVFNTKVKLKLYAEKYNKSLGARLEQLSWNFTQGVKQKTWVVQDIRWSLPKHFHTYQDKNFKFSSPFRNTCIDMTLHLWICRCRTEHHLFGKEASSTIWQHIGLCLFVQVIKATRIEWKIGMMFEELNDMPIQVTVIRFLRKLAWPGNMPSLLYHKYLNKVSISIEKGRSSAVVTAVSVSHQIPGSNQQWELSRWVTKSWVEAVSPHLRGKVCLGLSLPRPHSCGRLCH